MRTTDRSFAALRLLLVLALPGLAACDDSTGPDRRLSSEDVAGIYSVCSLTFTPENPSQQPVDIRSEAFELSRPEDLPRLGVDVSPQTFELQFTPKGQFTDREIPGTYTLGRTEVVLTFATSGINPQSLLLPPRIDFEFQESPQALVLPSSGAYNVPRADYARLAGIPETGLAEQIPGRLSASFRTGACG